MYNGKYQNVKRINMSLLKVLPAVIALGTVAAVAAGVVTDLIMSDDTVEEVKNTTTKKEVLTKMKNLQNELARLSDLKMLNDRRESTSQVKSIELNVNGVEIGDLISMLEAELVALTAQYNQFD